MPARLYCESLPLDASEVELLWQQVISSRSFHDDVVGIRCVTREEMKELNMKYRKKETPTNVLTFSYENEHDVALCLPVAREEAGELELDERDYVALLLVHAFLHAAGMDHEKSEDEARTQAKAEQDILQAAGFSPIHL